MYTTYNLTTGPLHCHCQTYYCRPPIGVKCNNRPNKALFCVLCCDHQAVNCHGVAKEESSQVTVWICSFQTSQAIRPICDDTWKCRICSVIFGSADDPKLHDDWITCTGCQNRYHESCAENDGVFDDDLQFTCKHCID